MATVQLALLPLCNPINEVISRIASRSRHGGGIALKGQNTEEFALPFQDEENMTPFAHGGVLCSGLVRVAIRVGTP